MMGLGSMRLGASATKIIETLYTNPGGTGDRAGSITVTADITIQTGTIDNWVDGDFSSNGTGSIDWGINNPVTNKFIKFDFGAGVSKVIQEARFKQSTSASRGTWKWQGSNNDSDWTDLTGNFTLGGGTVTTHDMSSNVTGYRYYRLLGISGASATTGWSQEMEFKIDDA